MLKVQWIAGVCTLLLAAPFIGLAITGLAYMTDHSAQIGAMLVSLNEKISIGGRGVIVETTARWPEIAGMIAGQLVILSIFVLARNGKFAK